MQKPKPTREERELQLREMGRTRAGTDEIHRLFRACFPAGVSPPIGLLMYQTILEHEYPTQGQG